MTFSIMTCCCSLFPSNLVISNHIGQSHYSYSMTHTVLKEVPNDNRRISFEFRLKSSSSSPYEYTDRIKRFSYNCILPILNENLLSF